MVRTPSISAAENREVAEKARGWDGIGTGIALPRFWASTSARLLWINPSCGAFAALDQRRRRRFTSPISTREPEMIVANEDLGVRAAPRSSTRRSVGSRGAAIEREPEVKVRVR